MGRYDAYLRKYDSEGSELWTRQFGSQDFDLAWNVAIDDTGNLYVVGWTRGAFPGQTPLGDFDSFARKYDGDGNEIWTHQFGTNHDEVASGVVVDGAGNLYLVGYTEGVLPGQTSLGLRDAFVVKMSGSPETIRGNVNGEEGVDK